MRDRKSCYLPPRVSVIVLVWIPHSKLLWVFFFDHLVRHFFTHTLKHRTTEDTPLARPPCNTSAYLQHLSHLESSTAHRELPAPLLSEWCVSAGWSKPSGLTLHVPQQNPSELPRTDGEKICQSRLLIISKWEATIRCMFHDYQWLC